MFLAYAAQNEIPGGRTMVQLAMRYTTPGSRFVNDMQMRPFPMRTEHLPVTYDLRDQGSPTGFNIGMQKAVSSGTLKLRSSDPHEQPNLDYRYLTETFDRERMRGAVRLCVDISESKEHDVFPVTRISPTDDDLFTDDALDRWLFANVMTQHHSSGTCKMGPSTDPMAVVDQYCRVHGLEGLRVIDASIMPDVVRANTNATTIMIAEKLADWLANGAY